MKIYLAAHTRIEPDTLMQATGGQWIPPVSGDGSALSEFAGRGCYESWKKPNPATASNSGYLAHILDVRHFSVLEHGTVSLYLVDVSRSLTHEIIRHRHLSPSQKSQRFVALKGSFVTPPLFRGDREANQVLEKAWHNAVYAYDQLLDLAYKRLQEEGVQGTHLRKRAREAARAVLPNMTPTAILLTGNHRSWREFLEKRGSIDADAEIRETALEVFQILRNLEPHIYQDFHLENIEGQECVIRGE